ncbi:MAG: TRAP transporter small permease [Alphaproteobacteria bacterium]
MPVVLRRIVDFLLDAMCAVFMATIVAVTAFQVTNRFLIQYPFTWTEEIARFLAVWVCLLGAARCVREGSHIEIDLLFKALPARVQWVLSIVIHLIFLMMCWVLIKYTWMVLPIVARQTSPAAMLPMSYVYLATPVSAAIMAFYLVDNLIRILGQWRRPVAAGRRGEDADIV